MIEKKDRSKLTSAPASAALSATSRSSLGRRWPGVPEVAEARTERGRREGEEEGRRGDVVDLEIGDDDKDAAAPGLVAAASAGAANL